MNPFSSLTATCCQGENAIACICGKEERILRGYIRGDSLAAMTPEQRSWCLNEIESVEGFRRSDYEQVSDSELARGVLDAWRDYCRDKGIYD